MQDAAGRFRKLRDKSLLGRALGDEIRLDAVSAERLRGPRADRSDSAGPALEPPQKRLDGVPARDEDPVVAVGLDRRPVDLFDADERRRDDLEASRAQTLRQALVGARDGDSHGTAASSSSARASGSSPRLRSIHAPSSAAISAVSASPS